TGVGGGRSGGGGVSSTLRGFSLRYGELSTALALQTFENAWPLLIGSRHVMICTYWARTVASPSDSDSSATSCASTSLASCPTVVDANPAHDTGVPCPSVTT